MSLQEFNSRLSSIDEKSVLFETLRKVSRMENRQDLDCEDVMWLEWNVPSPDGGHGGRHSGKP